MKRYTVLFFVLFTMLGASGCDSTVDLGTGTNVVDGDDEVDFPADDDDDESDGDLPDVDGDEEDPTDCGDIPEGFQCPQDAECARFETRRLPYPTCDAYCVGLAKEDGTSCGYEGECRAGTCMEPGEDGDEDVCPPIPEEFSCPSATDCLRYTERQAPYPYCNVLYCEPDLFNEDGFCAEGGWVGTCEGGVCQTEPPVDGDETDGDEDLTDGDETDGDEELTDGDETDGDEIDGDQEEPCEYQEYSTDDLPVGIPDANECGIGVYLTVDESEIAEDFCLDLEIAHDSPADLRIELEDPSGLVHALFDRNAGTSDLNGELTLEQFNGTDIEGTWILKASDLMPQDMGFITYFAIRGDCSPDLTDGDETDGDEDMTDGDETDGDEDLTDGDETDGDEDLTDGDETDGDEDLTDGDETDGDEEVEYDYTCAAPRELTVNVPVVGDDAVGVDVLDSYGCATLSYIGEDPEHVYYFQNPYDERTLFTFALENRDPMTYLGLALLTDCQDGDSCVDGGESADYGEDVSLTLFMEAGEAFYLVVDGYDGMGDYTLTVEGPDETDGDEDLTDGDETDGDEDLTDGDETDGDEDLTDGDETDGDEDLTDRDETDGDEDLTDGDETDGDEDLTDGDETDGDEDLTDGDETDGDEDLTDGDETDGDEDLTDGDETDGDEDLSDGDEDVTDGDEDLTDGDEDLTDGDEGLTDGDETDGDEEVEYDYTCAAPRELSVNVPVVGDGVVGVDALDSYGCATLSYIGEDPEHVYYFQNPYDERTLFTFSLDNRDEWMLLGLALLTDCSDGQSCVDGGEGADYGEDVSLTLFMEAGEAFYLVVDGYDGMGDYTLTVEGPDITDGDEDMTDGDETDGDEDLTDGDEYLTDGDEDEDSPPVEPLADELIITEYMPRSTSGEDPAEWVEIANVSDHAISLDLIRLADNTTNCSLSGIVLEAGEHAVITGQLPWTETLRTERNVVKTNCGFSLGNTSDTISILMSPSKGVYTTLDQLSYGSSDVTLGVSRQLDSLNYLSDAATRHANFCASETSFEDNVYGTPGSANAVCR